MIVSNAVCQKKWHTEGENLCVSNDIIGQPEKNKLYGHWTLGLVS